MDYTPGIFGFGPFGHFIGAIVGGLLSLFLFLVVIGLLFLLVRFLLVATKAAHIYVAKNSPAAPPAATPRSGSAGPAYAPKPTTVVAPTTPVATTPPKPATKPRTPKPPVTPPAV
jgi:predicted lipid-binding transport protein (Tim44 family)